MAVDPNCGMKVNEREAEKRSLVAVVGGKKYYFCSEHCKREVTASKKPAHAHHELEPTTVSYTCPMHPEIHRSKPGMCPECGMQLIPEEKPPEKEFDKHAGHVPDVFAKKFWISLALTIPVVLYSDLPMELGQHGLMPPAFPGSEYLSLVLSSIIFFYCGEIFLSGAYRELKARMPGMMTLIGLAVSSAYLYSVYATFTTAGGTLFWELTTLITIMLLGHWIEMLAVKGAQGALKELAKLLPDKTEVIRNGKPVLIPLEELRTGDVVLVRPGGKIPADGVVVSGDSDVNEALVTGESKPVKKTTKNDVIGGSINGDGSLKIKVMRIGEDTFLAGVMRLVQEAQASKSKIQLLADRAAFYLTIIAVVTGTITMVGWIAAGQGFNFAIERLVAVLVITCPHALGLAIPLVASISTTLSAKNGLLVRQRLALEAARKVDVVLFDKTGTLTKGEYGVTRVLAASGFDEKKVLQLAASVDSHSEHFVARAIVIHAKNKGVKLSEVKKFQRLPGVGVKGIVAGKMVTVGGQALTEKLSLPPALKKQAAELSKQGQTIIYVLTDKKLAGVIALADLIREESRQAVKDLKKLGVRVGMITGDSEDVAKWVSSELGVDEYFARVMPEQKAGKVKLLQSKGFKVAMVGDGINDAPALTQADVGIAIGAGTNVAIESAGIILVRNDPRDIVKIINLSRKTYDKMIQNLFWATGYNVVALPLAAGVLYSQGILLQPAVAAVLMSFSTVIVAANAVLLARVKL